MKLPIWIEESLPQELRARVQNMGLEDVKLAQRTLKITLGWMGGAALFFALGLLLALFTQPRISMIITPTIMSIAGFTVVPYLAWKNSRRMSKNQARFQCVSVINPKVLLIQLSTPIIMSALMMIDVQEKNRGVQAVGVFLAILTPSFLAALYASLKGLHALIKDTEKPGRRKKVKHKRWNASHLPS